MMGPNDSLQSKMALVDTVHRLDFWEEILKDGSYKLTSAFVRSVT